MIWLLLYVILNIVVANFYGLKLNKLKNKKPFFFLVGILFYFLLTTPAVIVIYIHLLINKLTN